MLLRFANALLVLLFLSACYVTLSENINPTRPSITLAPITPAVSATASPTSSFPTMTFDALPVMQGICFEAAWDASGQVFIMRNAEEHIRFYDAVDNSRLCRRLVERLPFEFSTGDVLAGLWNRGNGCTASHSITSFQRDDATKTIAIQVLFETQGDCPYELVRGFWIGINNAQDYQITIDFSQ